jgi:proline iminopeptidase
MPAIARIELSFHGGTIWIGVHGHERPGRPLLCVPGGPGLPHDYLDPLIALADERPVAFYDPIGCGRSSRLSLSWSRELLVDELAAVRDALGPEPLHVLLHSDAGLFALDDVLARPLAYASVVLASVPLDIPAYTRQVEALIDALPVELAAALRAGEHHPGQRGASYGHAYDEFVRRFVIRLPVLPHGMQRASVGLNRDALGAIKGGMLLHTGPCRTWSIAARLPELTMPVLLTCGRHGAVTPAANADTAARLPRAMTAVFEQASHMPHLEEPAAFLAAVRGFLAQMDRCGTP